MEKKMEKKRKTKAKEKEKQAKKKKTLETVKMPVYVITGTNRGLGLEFVRQLSRSVDNTIIGTVRTLQKDHSVLTSLIQQQQQQQHHDDGDGDEKKIHILECDTGKVASIIQFGKEVEKVLAGRKIDYLVNNSGINDTPEDTSLTMTPESLHEHIDVNVIGPQKVTAVLVPQLSRDCVILNMTSGLGSMQRARDTVAGNQTRSRSMTYSISKASLNMLTIHQAVDLKRKVKAVITMDPGWVKTDMGGKRALMEPEDSIAGMLKVIHSVTREDTAKYYHSSGGQVPW